VQRLLIHTWVSDLPDTQWPEDFPYPSVEVIDWLAGWGVVLLGVDGPSMDTLDSKDLPGHHALLRHGMVNLESLMLRNVPDGVYELIALPLKIDGVCASPVRAILRTV
jgi:arylformamidase